jgi:hypothetical protein
MGDFSIKPKKINKYKNINSSRKEENQNKIKPNVTPSWKEEKGNKMKPNVKSMKVGGYVNKMKDGKKVEVKDGKIIKRESSDETLNKMKKGNLYSDLKNKYKNKQSKDSLSSAEKREINKKNREKNYKNFNFENNPEYALGLLPAGKLISKIPGVKQGISKTIGGAKNIFSKFRSDKKPSNAVAISPKGGGGQGSGKYNPPIVRPTTGIKKNDSSVIKKPTELKKTSTDIVTNTNSQKLSNPFPKVVADIALKGSLLSTPSSAKAIASNNAKVELPKPRPEKIKPNDIKTKIIESKPILKSKPIKKTNITAGGNTGFGAKGNVFVSGDKRRKELMDKYGGTGSKAAEAAFAGTQGNMIQRARSGGLMKVRGGGAATRGMNFNKGK